MINNRLIDWELRTLGDVADYINGRAFKPSEWKKVGYPILRIQNLNKSTAPYNYSDQEFEDRYKVVKGDLLFAWSASLGVYLWKGDNAWLNQHIFKVVPKPLIHKYYLYYFLEKIVSELYTKTHGSGMVHITKGKFEATEIPVPHIDTQKAIVSKIEELFSELDKGIENLKIAREHLKVYRQSVLKWAFDGRLTSKDESFENIELQIAAEGCPVYEKPVLPQGWRIDALKTICLVKRGKSKHRPRNETSLYNGKYPFIQTGDIRNANGGFITKYTQTYSELGLEQSKLWPKGTLCITIAANIGETAILGFDACFPDSVVGLVGKEELVSTKYLNYFFIYYKSTLEGLAPATAQKNINVDILEKIRVPLAPLQVQAKVIEEIEFRLSVADKMEETINQSLLQSESLRQSILKKAFEGKLVQ